ncbi:hypothetical protein GCM10009525_88500 [Streptosporangium amethystogenes subsp. fukuiense]
MEKLTCFKTWDRKPFCALGHGHEGKCDTATPDSVEESKRKEIAADPYYRGDYVTMFGDDE